MKKIKNLSILLIAVIISSAGLTSCVESNVDPVIKEIYQNQALLLASQAGFLDAQANYQDAKAAAELAMAQQHLAQAAKLLAEAEEALARANETDVDSEIARDEADARLAEAEAKLVQTIAETQLAAEKALIKLQKAQLQWEIDMIALEATLEEAGTLLAIHYFGRYTTAMNLGIMNDADIIAKESEIAVAELLLITPPGITYEFWLAQLEVALADKESALAAEEAVAAGLAAALADPTTREAQSTELQGWIDENDAIIDDLDIDIAEIQADIALLQLDLAELYTDIDANYHTVFDALNDAGTGAYDIQEGLEDDIEDAQEDIDDLEPRIASYDADLAAAETADDDAKAALGEDNSTGPAFPVWPASGGPYGTIPNPASNNPTTGAHLAYQEAYIAWYDLDAEVTALAGNLNAAATALANATSSDDGADADVAAAQTVFDDAETAYLAAKTAWEANMTGWTYSDPGPDGIMGDHSDDDFSTLPGSNVSATFREVVLADLTVPVPVTGYTAANFNATILAADGLLPAPPVTVPVTPPYVEGTLVTEYYNVEADDGDDVAPTSNKDVFDAATIAYNAAELDLNTKIGLADNSSTVLADAQALYDHLNEVLTDGIADLAVLDDARNTTGMELYDADKIVYGGWLYADATDPINPNDPDDELNGTEDDLFDLENYDADDMAADVVTAYHTITEAELTLAILDTTIAELEAALAAIEDALDAASSTEIAAVVEAIADLAAELGALQAEQGILTDLNAAYLTVVTAIGMDNEDIEALLVLSNAAIVTLTQDVHEMENGIAVGEIDAATVEANIAILEAELDALISRGATIEAIATKYYDLLIAALS